MPVSVSSSKAVFDALRANQVRIMSALPETWLVHMIRMAEEDPEVTLVRLAKEEEGVGVSAGAHLAGVRSAMLMQNHGLFASVNAVISCALLYRIPLLMLISHRGHMGEPDPWQTEGGLLTTGVLDTLGVPHETLTRAEDAPARVRAAQTLASSALRPVALLLDRALMWEEA